MTALGTRATRLVVLVVVLTVGTVGFVGPVGITAGDSHPESAVGTAHVPLNQNQNQNGESEVNETVRHRNPGEYSEAGNPEQVEAWLIERMTDNIDEGAIRIEEGEYDLAERYTGDEFTGYLEQYHNISSVTERADRGDLLEAVRDEQNELISAAREYDELKNRYEDARAAGNEERARELARELDEIASSANESGAQLRDQYDELESTTDANLSDSDAAIETATEEIRASQTEIREEQFVGTVLTVDSAAEDVSFLEPVTGVGQLRTVDGAPVANEPVTLEIGNGSVRTTTDDNGRFEFEYRPTDERLSKEQLEIKYVPAPDSIYLGSETTVNVSISQTEPTVSAFETTDEASYGDNATVSGELTANGVPVDGVPLAVTIGDERIGTTETTNGSFEAAAAVPAAVADGEREIGVRVDYDDRAIAAAATDPITIRETESDLSLSASRVDAEERTIDVNGALKTADGEGVGNQEIRLEMDGTTLDTVATGEDGAFNATVPLPDESGGDAELVATYDGSESNIESATTRTAVTLSTSETRAWWPLPTWMWLGIGPGAVFLLGITGLWWRRRASHASDGAVSDAPTADETASTRPTADRSRTAIAQSLLAHGRDCLADGRPDRAAEMGYAAVRHAFSDRIDTGTTSTHWEFYRTWQRHRDEECDGESTDGASRLRTVIECYEQTMFGVTGVSSSQAEAALEAASRLCDTNSAPNDGSTDSEAGNQSG